MDNNIPIGYIRVHKHMLPENGREYYTFTKWTGTCWVSCQPPKAGELIQARTDPRGKIRNAY